MASLNVTAVDLNAKEFPGVVRLELRDADGATGVSLTVKEMEGANVAATQEKKDTTWR